MQIGTTPQPDEDRVRALAEDNERLRRHSLRAAEEERRRWARELHDETLQSLGALRIALSSARRQEDPASMREALDTALAEVQREIVGLRALIAELRPAALDELGLESALDELVERVRASGLEVNASISLPRAGLEADLETTVYRLVQESLNNAIRHAGGERVAIEICERQGEITVVVCDDGVGFDAEAVHAGFGLTGMRERAELAGGKLEICSDAAGTVILATLPVARSATAHGRAGGSLPATEPAASTSASGGNGTPRRNGTPPTAASLRLCEPRTPTAAR